MNSLCLKQVGNLSGNLQSFLIISLSLVNSIILASPVGGVALSFSTIDSSVNLVDDGKMIFESVATDNTTSTTLDLVVEVVDNYQANKPSNNGVTNGNDGRINIKSDTSSIFKFRLVEENTDTNYRSRSSRFWSVRY